MKYASVVWLSLLGIAMHNGAMANDNSTPVQQSTLQELIAGAALQSLDGSFRFSSFQISGPSINEVLDATITADSSNTTGELLVQLEGGDRLQLAGERIEFDLAFVAENTISQHVISSAGLDLGGGSFGTTGDAAVRIAEVIGDPLNPLATLSVVDSPTAVSKLFDATPVAGSATWLARLNIVSDGGTDAASAAVLTDFTASFTVSPIPEPTSGISAAILLAGLVQIRRSKLVG